LWRSVIFDLSQKSSHMNYLTWSLSQSQMILRSQISLVETTTKTIDGHKHRRTCPVQGGWRQWKFNLTYNNTSINTDSNEISIYAVITITTNDMLRLLVRIVFCALLRQLAIFLNLGYTYRPQNSGAQLCGAAGLNRS